MGDPATLGQACRALEESLKLMDRGDTTLNLAECHRRQGKTASAWAEFDRAWPSAPRSAFPRPYERRSGCATPLAAKLSMLTVTVPPATAALAGLTVEVNGKPLAARALEHRVRDRSWSIQVALGPRDTCPSTSPRARADRDAKGVVVVLQAEPPPLPPLPPPESSSGREVAAPLWPKVVGAAGASLGLSGIGFELVSLQATRSWTRSAGRSSIVSARGTTPVPFATASCAASGSSWGWE